MPFEPPASQSVWHVLPRGMRFDRDNATSIDLFVSEVASHSRFSTRIFAEHTGEPLPAAELIRLPRHRFADTFQRARFVAGHAARGRADLILVQQHLPCAAAMASRVQGPVVLQKHNFVRPPRRGGWLAGMSEQRHVGQLRSLAGITFVSEAVLRDFEHNWPDATMPRCIIPNGIDLTAWSPSPVREQTILVVGRATAEKGLRESAQALASVLTAHPGWTTTFVASEGDRNAEYLRSVQSALAPLGPRARLLQNLPASEVRRLNEKAAIAIVPSIWQEPFGRTCLEAHAGGAAVISSGTGGLPEISGEHALYLPAVTPDVIAEAVGHLIREDARRNELARGGEARVHRLFALSRIAGSLDDFCASIMLGAELRMSGKRLP